MNKGLYMEIDNKCKWFYNFLYKRS